MVIKIGITGGLASGKSHCLKYLASLDSPRVYTMNLDHFANQIYKLNPFALKNVESIFGRDTVIRSKYGDSITAVNRVQLGKKVFESDAQLNALKSITSPEIKKLTLEHFRHAEKSGKYDLIAVEGAILIEANTYKFFDELWVVTLPKELALQRALARDSHLTE